MENNELSNLKKNTWYAILVKIDNKYQNYAFKKGSFGSIIIGEDGKTRKTKSIEAVFEDSLIISLEQCPNKEKALINASNMYNKALLADELKAINESSRKKESEMTLKIKKMEESLEEIKENRELMLKKYNALYKDKETAISSICSCLFNCCTYHYTESGVKYELVEPNELERQINPNKRKVRVPFRRESDMKVSLYSCLCDIRSNIDDKYKKAISDIIELYENSNLDCFDEKNIKEVCEMLSIQEYIKRYSCVLSLTEKLSKFLIMYKNKCGKKLRYFHSHDNEDYYYDTHVTIENDDLINEAIIICGNLLEVLKGTRYKHFFAVAIPDFPTEVVEQENKTL